MTLVLPGIGSTYLPSHEATGKLQIEFTRNPARFALTRYAKYIPMSKDVGYYLRIDTAEAKRIIASGAEFVWRDGADTPRGSAESFEWLPVAALRHAFPFELGDKAVGQATWDIIASHARIRAQQAMTNRSRKAAVELTAHGNWDTGHADTATNLGGGIWSTSSASNLYILKTINEAVLRIIRDTNGVVMPDDLVIVVDPVGARVISESPEYRQYVVNNPIAAAAAQGTEMFQLFGLMPKLYGLNVVVDVTPFQTANEGETNVNKFLFSGITTYNTVAAIVSRPGGLMGVEGAPEFSTLSVFNREELTIEVKYDSDNRRHLGRVVDDFVAKLTAPATGVLIENLAG